MPGKGPDGGTQMSSRKLDTGNLGREIGTARQALADQRKGFESQQRQTERERAAEQRRNLANMMEDMRLMRQEGRNVQAELQRRVDKTEAAFEHTRERMDARLAREQAEAEERIAGRDARIKALRGKLETDTRAHLTGIPLSV